MVRCAKKNRKQAEYKYSLGGQCREVTIRFIKAGESELFRSIKGSDDTVLARVYPSANCLDGEIEIYTDHILNRLMTDEALSRVLLEKQISRMSRFLTLMFALVHEVLHCLEDRILDIPVTFKLEGKVTV